MILRVDWSLKTVGVPYYLEGHNKGKNVRVQLPRDHPRVPKRTQMLEKGAAKDSVQQKKVEDTSSRASHSRFLCIHNCNEAHFSKILIDKMRIFLREAQPLS